ncbi:MAG: GMC family oxidoreductase [Janthinobacterium lividum]
MPTAKSVASDYDFIIIGGGSAGCVLANRLSADPSVRVALIEAGPSDRSFPANIKTRLPSGMLFLLPHAKYNWQYSFTGKAGINGRSVICPRGKVLGGTSSVNGMIYIRGHRLDYDEWAALGNPGWSYAEVLPYFKKHENNPHGEAGYHGKGGEVEVGVPTQINLLSRAFVKAAAEAGQPMTTDNNGASQDGIGLNHVNHKYGKRFSSSRAFLHPIWNRPNLTIITEALVERIDFQDKRATGVTMTRAGQRQSLTAAREVLLCGGAINSPQLLMLSGIGPRAELQRHGIEVRVDLPGVGQNLQDHPTVQVTMSNPGGESYALSPRNWLNVLTSPISYLFGHKGMLGTHGAEAGGYIRTRQGLDRPDVQLTFVAGHKKSLAQMPRTHGMMTMVHLMRPRTRGYIELTSARPTDKPALHPNFLEDPEDVQTLLRGVRDVRRMLASPAIARYTGEELTPGGELVSDEQLIQAIRAQVGTAYHPVGTCKMGPASDPLAVVDAKLRVYGVQGLRVVDASIMPNIIGGNTNAPTMMIGERAASFILNPQDEAQEQAPVRQDAVRDRELEVLA